MAHEFVSGFFVREPAWHELGTVIPDYLPLKTEGDIEAAMRLAGHDFEVFPQDTYILRTANDASSYQRQDGWKAFTKRMPGDPTDGALLHVARESYTAVSNRACWELMRDIIGEGLRMETAVTLRGGAVCSLLAWLNEPVRVTGDDSDLLP